MPVPHVCNTPDTYTNVCMHKHTHTRHSTGKVMFQNGALWDMGQVHSGTCEIVLFTSHLSIIAAISSVIHSLSEFTQWGVNGCPFLLVSPMKGTYLWLDLCHRAIMLGVPYADNGGKWWPVDGITGLQGFTGCSLGESDPRGWQGENQITMVSEPRKLESAL